MNLCEHVSVGLLVATLVGGLHAGELAHVLQSKPQSHIEGRVTDHAGKPIAEARIEWGYIQDAPEKWQRATTDAEGRYRIDPRDHGVDYRLSISAPGMAPQWLIPRASWHGSLGGMPRDKDVPPPQTANFQLEPQHRLTGIVVDDNGQPIPAVTIRAETPVTGFHSSFSSPSPAMPIPGPGPFTTTTADDGRFTLDHLPTGYIHLTLNTPHRHVNSQNYAVDRDAHIVMSGSGRAGIIRARVVASQASRPVQSFTLLRRYIPKPELIASPTGQFKLTDGLTEGSVYVVHVYAQDHAPAVANLVAAPVGSDEETTIELQPGHPLLGQLADAQTGKPLREVPVLYGVVEGKSNTYFEWPDRKNYVDGYHPFTTVQHATTDDHGNFWFSEAPDRLDGTLFVIAPGFERLILKPADRPRASGNGHIQIKLAPEAGISGILVQNGKPQPDVEVSVWKQEPRGNIDETFEKVRTDARGIFRVGCLAPGIYGVSYWTHAARTIRRAKPITTVVLTSGEQKNLESITIGEELPGNVSD